MPRRGYTRELAGMLTIVVLVGCGATNPRGTRARSPEAAAIPGGWLARVQSGIAQREYRASPSARGLQAPNRAHDLRTYFEPTGIRIHDRTATGSPRLLGLVLAGVGRGQRLSEPGAGRIASEGSRVEIQHQDVLEWYENSDAGLEQGFDLPARPAGDGPLAIELRIEDASASLRGDAVVIHTPTGRTLRYADLRAWDATGRALPTRIELPAGQRLRLAVEDADAVYPVVVDPLLTETADTQLASSQTAAAFGFSVAGAGDVNGDGYADVIVGAPTMTRRRPDSGGGLRLPGQRDRHRGRQPRHRARAARVQPDIGLPGPQRRGGRRRQRRWLRGRHRRSSQRRRGPAVRGSRARLPRQRAGIADGDATAADTQLESNQAAAYLGGVRGRGRRRERRRLCRRDRRSPLLRRGQTNEGARLHLPRQRRRDRRERRSRHGRTPARVGPGGRGVRRQRGGRRRRERRRLRRRHRGRPLLRRGRDNEGAAFVFLGSAAGHRRTATRRRPTPSSSRTRSDAHLGHSVAGAGDVNGDGYADSSSGRRSYDAGETDEGAAFVFLGSAPGIAGRRPRDGRCAARVEPGDVALPRLRAWPGPGDVNGDGYADVIVGAPQLRRGRPRTRGPPSSSSAARRGSLDGDPSDGRTRSSSRTRRARICGCERGGRGRRERRRLRRRHRRRPLYDARRDRRGGRASSSWEGATGIVGLAIPDAAPGSSRNQAAPSSA